MLIQRIGPQGNRFVFLPPSSLLTRPFEDIENRNKGDEKQENA